MCGFVGRIGDGPAAPPLAAGIAALQHRGYDAAGLGTRDGLRRGLGRVGDVLTPEVVGSISGNAGLAHVRYPTSGARRDDPADAQPMPMSRSGDLVAFNGHIANAAALGAEVGLPATATDATVLACWLGTRWAAVTSAEPPVDAILVVLREFSRLAEGAWSVAALVEIEGEAALVAWRDPHGRRPAVYGADPHGSWAVASEPVALAAMGCAVRGSIPAGHAVVLRAHREPEIHRLAPSEPRPCVVESLYYADPRSTLEHGPVAEFRQRLGQELASAVAKKGLTLDAVIAIPASAQIAAAAVASELGLPLVEGFDTPTTRLRSFILGDPASRQAAARAKLVPRPEAFGGQRVLLVDDSLVRGTTLQTLLPALRALRPAAIHLAIAAPPLRHPCRFGFDLPSTDEFFAATLPFPDPEPEAARRLGVDTLTYLPRAGLDRVSGPATCTVCFGDPNTAGFAHPIRGSH
jgi:amidophosphoribosyltransferase